MMAKKSANRRSFLGLLAGASLLATTLLLGTEAARAQPPRRSFGPGDRMVMTYLFDWYNVPTNEHIVTPKGTDALTIHPAPQTFWYDKNPDYRKRRPPIITNAPQLSYANPAWFAAELSTMIAAEIDAVAVDFWGYPWPDVPPRSRYSLEVMNAAMDAMDAAGRSYPAILMFLETVPLGNAGHPTDLSTEAGAQWLFGLVQDFYGRVARHRVALFSGKVPVILYAADIPGLKIDAYGLRRCREMFRAWYGRDLVFFGNSTWASRAKGQITYSCHWGAAVRPSRLVDSTDLMEISPGYNYMGNLGANRTPPDPDAYRAAWEAARRTGRNWISIETYNEFHESTAIARTVEGGDLLLRITQSQARRFKNRQ